MFIHDLMQLLASVFQPRALFFPDRRVVVFRIDPVVSGSQASVQDTAVHVPQIVIPFARNSKVRESCRERANLRERMGARQP